MFDKLFMHSFILYSTIQSVYIFSCTFCESVVGRESLHEHIEQHTRNNNGKFEFELPYSCSQCSYRTTFRDAFLTHFVRKHRGSNVVPCPFCLIEFKISETDRRRPSITMPQYVDHILSHDTDNFHSCHYCAAKIPAQSASNSDMNSGGISDAIRRHYKLHRQNLKKDIKDWSKKAQNRGKTFIVKSN